MTFGMLDHSPLVVGKVFLCMIYLKGEYQEKPWMLLLVTSSPPVTPKTSSPRRPNALLSGGGKGGLELFSFMLGTTLGQGIALWHH